MESWNRLAHPQHSTHLGWLSRSDSLLERASGKTLSTENDARDMYRLGKTQELRRNFRLLPMLGLSSLIAATWVTILATSSYSLVNGGLAGTVWMYLGIWIFMFTVQLSLAEMASMAPSSGGQYHFTSEFAPESCQAALSYLVGWLSTIAWQAGIAMPAYIAANIILEMAHLSFPSYDPMPWHGTLMTMAVALVSVTFNTLGAKHLPWLEGMVLCLHILGFFAVVMTLWLLAPKASATEVFTVFQNFGGWSSIGGACLIGQLATSSALPGGDSPAHMAEEIHNAAITIPRVMIITLLLNGALGFVMVVTYCFCITDIVAMIVENPSVFPFITVFQAATGSTGGTIALLSIITILNICSTISTVATASRQIWAFARDEGVPYSGWFRKVTTVGIPIPLNAILFSLTITLVISLLNLAGLTAFDSLMSLVVATGGTSYLISISCVLWRRLAGPPLPYSPFSLGVWGVPINLVAVFLMIGGISLTFFPPIHNPSLKEFNWGLPLFVCSMLVSAIYYVFQGRKVYRGPVVYLNRLEQR